ncbi:DUF4139 domain-containing protein [Streptomyces sp. NPDC047737]|uniref:DUF4139 domain-containing protein n=1 Tax=Streptomyces sp. NPDC047737 TaxID=3155740 RepID=UPI0033FDE8DE
MTAEAAQRWGSTLDSVVVYEQGAVCRRLARGSVPPDGRVRVTGLPRSLDQGSLRARVLGTSGARVSEARVEVEAEMPGTSPPDELRREAERLKDEYAAARARKDHVLGRIKEMTSLRPVPPARKREDPHRVAPVDAWLELAAFVDERLAGLHASLVEVEETLLRVEHDLDVATDRLARASTDVPSAPVDTTISALLILDATSMDDAAAEVELELDYGVPGAVWVPAYRLTYRQGEDRGRLLLRASVAQRTGEDWTGVFVALATADLRRGTDLPSLRSVRIGRRQAAAEPSGWRAPPAGLADLFTGYDASGPRPVTTAAVAVGGIGAAPPPPPAPPAYGGAPPAPSGPAPQSGPPAAAARSVRARTGAGGAFGGSSPAPFAPAAPGAAAPPPPPPMAPVAGPPRPSGGDLDYAALVLAGPEDQAGRRGRLFPGSAFDPVAAEHRRRAEAVAALPLPHHAVRPRESAGSFDHRFDTAARADVPSDGTWHTVTIGEIPVGAHTEHLCIPAVEQTVYATLVLSNATDQSLLAGPVEVIVDDDFLLTAALPTLAPGGVRRVGLGPAQGVQVTRRTHVNESTSGLRNNITVLDHRVHVELANRLAVPVALEVRERVPVTSEADVRIEERADWVPLDDDGAEAGRHAPGTRAWRVDLPAGGTAVLDGGYEIRIPAGKALVGGNRRS